MKESKKTLLALASVCILMAAGGATMITVSECEATEANNTLSNDTLEVDNYYEKKITGVRDFELVSLSPSFLSVTYESKSQTITVKGTPNTVGDYQVVLVAYTQVNYQYRQATWTWTLHVEPHLLGTYTGYVGDSAYFDRIMLGSSITSGSIPGVTFSSSVYDGSSYIDMNGLFTTPGTYSVTSNAGYTWNFVIQPKFTIVFDSMGGTSVPTIYRQSGEIYGDLPVPTKDGYRFDGWYYTEWDGVFTGPVGWEWTAFTDLTMWAKWTPLLEIPYTDPSNAIATINWSWTPTTLSGATVTVSGVDWLSVNGTNVYGVPPAPGDYTITVTITKAGYADRTETFVLTVVSKLVPTNSPLNGAIFKL
ncbi:MAG: InlB B-repeat-containing protein [Methanosarcina mazei]|nr:InlB B-repeat-containing protein [Methanosarcina mazei]